MEEDAHAAAENGLCGPDQRKAATDNERFSLREFFYIYFFMILQIYIYNPLQI
jgi:hypothetical protein